MLRRRRSIIIISVVIAIVIAGIVASILVAHTHRSSNVTRYEWLRKMETQCEIAYDTKATHPQYFTDVHPDNPYYKTVQAAYEAGWLDHNPEFHGDEPATEEFVGITGAKSIGEYRAQTVLNTFDPLTNEQYYQLATQYHIAKSSRNRKVRQNECQERLKAIAELQNSEEANRNIEDIQLKKSTIVVPERQIVSYDEKTDVLILQTPETRSSSGEEASGENQSENSDGNSKTLPSSSDHVTEIVPSSRLRDRTVISFVGKDGTKVIRRVQSATPGNGQTSLQLQDTDPLDAFDEFKVRESVPVTNAMILDSLSAISDSVEPANTTTPTQASGKTLLTTDLMYHPEHSPITEPVKKSADNTIKNLHLTLKCQFSDHKITDIVVHAVGQAGENGAKIDQNYHVKPSEIQSLLAGDSSKSDEKGKSSKAETSHSEAVEIQWNVQNLRWIIDAELKDKSHKIDPHVGFMLNAKIKANINGAFSGEIRIPLKNVKTPKVFQKYADLKIGTYLSFDADGRASIQFGYHHTVAADTYLKKPASGSHQFTQFQSKLNLAAKLEIRPGFQSEIMIFPHNKRNIGMNAELYAGAGIQGHMILQTKKQSFSGKFYAPAAKASVEGHIFSKKFSPKPLFEFDENNAPWIIPIGEKNNFKKSKYLLNPEVKQPDVKSQFVNLTKHYVDIKDYEGKDYHVTFSLKGKTLIIYNYPSAVYGYGNNIMLLLMALENKPKAEVEKLAAVLSGQSGDVVLFPYFDMAQSGKINKIYLKDRDGNSLTYTFLCNPYKQVIKATVFEHRHTPDISYGPQDWNNSWSCYYQYDSQNQLTNNDGLLFEHYSANGVPQDIYSEDRLIHTKIRMSKKGKIQSINTILPQPYNYWYRITFDNKHRVKFLDTEIHGGYSMYAEYRYQNNHINQIIFWDSSDHAKVTEGNYADYIYIITLH